MGGAFGAALRQSRCQVGGPRFCRNSWRLAWPRAHHFPEDAVAAGPGEEGPGFPPAKGSVTSGYRETTSRAAMVQLKTFKWLGFLNQRRMPDPNPVQARALGVLTAMNTTAMSSTSARKRPCAA